MKTAACAPCAKRKVRCDRVEPTCSNCKRRKHDHCQYPEISPSERVKQLEDVIKGLHEQKNTPRSSTSIEDATSTTCVDDVVSTPGEGPAILQEDGRAIYLESQGWQTLIDITRVQGGTKPRASNSHITAHRSGRHLPHAFQGLKGPAAETECPEPGRNHITLWDVFLQRVELIIKISFSWTLEELRSALADPEQWRRLSRGKQSLALCCCFFGLVAFSKEECVSELGRSKAELLTEHRLECEQSFGRDNLLAIDDMTTLKAMCIYTVSSPVLTAGMTEDEIRVALTESYQKACVDLVTTQSLWSLMGLVSRSAELQGVHRDPQLMGLSPIETEERRRLWWQIQHLELVMAIKNGVTPLTFTADWDAKLPLNVEDSDLATAVESSATSRTGLTSFSYTLFTYWTIDQHRKFRQARLHQSASTDRSLLAAKAEKMIEHLENGLQTIFLQYCDPVKPRDTILQISARAVICILRLRSMHDARLSTGQPNGSFHEKYFDLCMQALGYPIATLQQSSMKQFFWLAEIGFPWHAFIAFLVDIPKVTNVGKVREAWALLDVLYGVTTFLTDFADDGRRVHAADQVLATWSACCQKPQLLDQLRKPDCVSRLEESLSLFRDERSSTENEVPDGGHHEFSDLLDFDFADIDWSYWDTASAPK